MSDGSPAAGVVNADNECTGWNTALAFTVSTTSCKGLNTCNSIGGSAVGGSVTINSNACNAELACSQIAAGSVPIISDLVVEVGTGACNIDYACNYIGYTAAVILSYQIPDNECNEFNTAGILNRFGTQLAGKCESCGADSTHTGSFIATNECCATDEIFGYSQRNNQDPACNGPVPSEEPSMLPSEIPSSLPSFTYAPANVFLR